MISLDILLPLTIDVTPDDEVIPFPRNIEEYLENYEGELFITFLSEKEIRFDYYCDDDTFLFEDKWYEENQYRLDYLTTAQYHLAHRMNIVTSDIIKNKSIVIDVNVPLKFNIGLRTYYLTLMFSNESVTFDYLCYDKFSTQTESLFDLYEYEPVQCTIEKDKLKESQKEINKMLTILEKYLEIL